MPISLVCDDCDKQFKVDERSAGKKVRCPKCQAVVAVPAADEEEEEDERPAPRRRESSREEVSDRPRGRTSPVRRDEEEEDRPAKRSRRDEEDDRPSSRRSRRDEDEVEDRPRGRKGGDRREEGFDDLDSPSRSKKPKKKGSGMLLWLGLGGGAAVLLLGCVACAGGAYFLDLLPFGSGLGAEAKYLPDNPESVTSVRIDQMRKTKLYQAQEGKKKEAGGGGGGGVGGLGGFGRFGRKGGLKEEDLDRVTISGSGREAVNIITTKRSVTADELKAEIRKDAAAGGGGGGKDLEFTEEKVDGYTIHVAKGGGGQAFCMPEGRIIVIATAETLRSILRRGKKPTFSPAFSRAWSSADFSSTVVIINASSKDEMGIGALMAGVGGKPEAVCLQTTLGTDVTSKAVAHYKDAASAEEGQRKAEENINKGDPMGFGGEAEKERKRNARVSRSGSTVTVTSSVKEQTMIDDMNKKKF